MFLAPPDIAPKVDLHLYIDCYEFLSLSVSFKVLHDRCYAL